MRNYMSDFKSNRPEDARFLSVCTSVVSLNVESQTGLTQMNKNTALCLR